MWTQHNLQSLLEDVLQTCLSSIGICLFADALDEFDGLQQELMDHLMYLQTTHGLKLCFSSRPPGTIEEGFPDATRLCLQNFTGSGIRKYVRDSVLGHHTVKSSQIFHDKAMHLAHRISSAAEGILLWVKIVVNMTVNGLDDGYTLDDTETRIEQLPSEIEALYAAMIQRIRKQYPKDAARYFRILRYMPYDPSITDLFLVGEQDSTADEPFSYHTVTVLTLVNKCRKFRRRLLSSTSNILEIVEPEEPRGWGARPPWSNANAEAEMFCSFKVRFVHRTAIDFLWQGDDGQDLFTLDESPTEFISLSIARGLLTRLYQPPAVRARKLL